MSGALWAFVIALTVAAANRTEPKDESSLFEKEFLQQHRQDRGDCGEHSFTFLGKCFCDAGWEGEKSIIEVPHAWPPSLAKHREAQSIPRRGEMRAPIRVACCYEAAMRMYDV
jgi:hypothetical protein